MVIEQGEVVWVDFSRAPGSEPSGRRPAVVLQSDRFNRSKIATVVVAAVTSNLALAAAPGNLRLRRGEAGLPRASVVNVSQLQTIDRGRILAKSGRLTRQRLREVWDGVRLLLAPPTS